MILNYNNNMSIINNNMGVINNNVGIESLTDVGR